MPRRRASRFPPVSRNFVHMFHTVEYVYCESRPARRPRAADSFSRLLNEIGPTSAGHSGPPGRGYSAAQPQHDRIPTVAVRSRMVSVSEVAFARSWHHFYARGVPHTIDIPDVPVTRLLDDAAEQYGRRTALVYFGREITYARLLKLVDRVALILPICPQFTVVWFAVLRIGAVAVPFNPLYTADEMRHQLHNSGATV